MRGGNLNDFGNLDDLIDAPARRAVSEQLDVTMMVEAAAGTGKTTSLVGRIVSLVRTDRCKSPNLAAITFTVKAAAHLRERLQEALETESRRAEVLAEKERLGAGLGQLDRAFIGTTHAFCARLLRERPVEAGLDPDFQELEEADARLLASDFWSRWIEAKRLASDPLLREIGEAGIDSPTLRSGFSRLVEYADVTMVSKRRPLPDLTPACAELLRFLEACEPHLPTDSMREKPDDFEKMIVGLIRKRQADPLTDLRSKMRFLEDADHASEKPVQKKWPSAAKAKELGEKYSGMVKGIIRPALREWREALHGLILDLLRPAIAGFAAERKRNGTLTFQDLLMCARDLLRDHPAVRLYFQSRFTHVLVDEFQDTDPIQAEVLFFLTSLDTKERRWRQATPRPGSLFIVGDPKQSIYRFRRADITTYLEVKRRIEETGGRVVQLSTNFRSLPAICEFVNGRAGVLFANASVEAGYQAPHVALAPARPAATPAGAFLLETPAGNVAEVARLEAKRVAAWIRRAVETKMEIDDGGSRRPLRWGDFLLVSKRKPRLSIYSRALEREGIPVELTGGSSFAESEELRALVPLLAAVAEPDDAVSLAAFLRGPLCGADDEALYRFVRAGGHFSLYRELPAEIDPRLAAGFEIVRQAGREARELPPVAALARLADRLGLTALAASRPQGATRSGNLLLALALARKQSSRGASLAAIVARIESLVDPDRPHPKNEIVEMDVDPLRAGAVRVMNLHQVKGLEAPIVFLIDPAKPNKKLEIDLHVDRSDEESRGYVVISREVGSFGATKEVAVPPDWDKFEKIEEAFSGAEDMRLLYVAATRAKNLLVVGCTPGKNGPEGSWRNLAGGLAVPLFDLGDLAVSAVEATGRRSGSLGESLAQARAAIENRFAVARQASYSVLPVTKIAHQDHGEFVSAEEGLGRGTSWGRVLHRLFEAMLRDQTLDVRLYAKNLLKDEEREPAELEEVMRVVDTLRGSGLWRRVLAADEKLMEVPFAITVPARELGLGEAGETLLHGAIDLVFREAGEWFVIDYKSDSTVGRLEELVRYYRPQVGHYARFWERLTGQTTHAGLFFVDGCIERWDV